MEILDAQVEALTGDTVLNSAPVLPAAELTAGEREVLTVEAFLFAMSSVGVDGGLWHGFRGICESAISAFPDRFRAITIITDPGAQDLELECGFAAENPGVAGIRLLPSWPPTGESMALLRAGAFEPWLKAAEELGLVVSLFVPGNLGEVPAIAEAYPALRLLIDHLGMNPPPVMPVGRDWLDTLPNLLALARYENVAVKLTGAPALSFDPYPFPDLWPACHAVIDAFGTGRVMWGSDFHRVAPLHSYGEVVNFLRYTNELSEADKGLLLGGSLRSWIGWEPAGAGGEGEGVG